MKDKSITCYKCLDQFPNEHQWFDHECEGKAKLEYVDLNEPINITPIIIIAAVVWTTLIIITRILI